MTKEDQDILFYAFRYALGRKTAAVSQMVGIIMNRWDEISLRNRFQMKDEIIHAINIGCAGDNCDIEEWKKIVNLPDESKNFRSS